MRALRQIAAIARTELCFGLRRGWPVVGTAVIGLVVSASTLWLAFMNMEGLPRRYAAEISAGALAMAWPAFQWLGLGVLPIVTAPAIPSDRQFGVDELLRSLPLTGTIYLAGKVLGTMTAVLLTGAATLALHLGLHLALIGPFDPSLYLELTVLSALPLLIWAPAVGVLAACGLRTRRAAIFVGVLVGMAGPLCWSLAFRPPADLGPYAGTASLLSRQPVSDFVLGRYGLLPAYVLPATNGEVVQVLVVAQLVLLVVAVAARLRLYWKENF
jgi:hypothetical protein